MAWNLSTDPNSAALSKQRCQAALGPGTLAGIGLESGLCNTNMHWPEASKSVLTVSPHLWTRMWAVPSLFLIYQNRLSEEVLSCKNIVTTENTYLFIFFYFSSKRPETQMGHNVLWQGKVMVSAWGGQGPDSWVQFHMLFKERSQRESYIACMVSEWILIKCFLILLAIYISDRWPSNVLSPSLDVEMAALIHFVNALKADNSLAKERWNGTIIYLWSLRCMAHKWKKVGHAFIRHQGFL